VSVRPDNREPIAINWRAVRDRSPLRRPCWRRRSGVDGMAHAATVNPVVLAGLLLAALRLVGWTIERMAMGRIPHPIAARRGRRAPWGIARNKRLARGGRGRRRRRGCGLPHRRLLSCGCRFYAADLINSIMKRFRPAEPDKHGGQEKLAEQAHERTSLSDQGWQIQGANTIPKTGQQDDMTGGRQEDKGSGRWPCSSPFALCSLSN